MILFTKMKETIIFADGSSIGNPGPGGWGVVMVRGKKVLELGGGEKRTTNNKMELTAAIEALRVVNKLQVTSNKLTIHTDSSYVINGITKWIRGWEKNKWIGTNKKEILNKDLWKKLGKLAKSKKIEWKHVRGHVGIAGNERADFLATMCAKEQKWKKEKFFDGPIKLYPFNVLNIKASRERVTAKKRLSGRAYSYLSLVGGVLVKHKTWPECEKRVKGVSGAKFKKALSAEDEEKIVREWGIK